MKLHEAAAALNISPGTLRRWIRDGAPVAHRGRRGRGHALLLDAEAVRAWRSAGTSETLQTFAARIPELLANAADEAFRAAEGVPARYRASLIAGYWYMATHALLDAIRAQGLDVPELEVVPHKIARIRSILG